MYTCCDIVVKSEGLLYGTLVVSFFFQAEDGIRDKLVTGVQTCALPICLYGPIVIEPRRGERHRADREHVVLLSEWTDRDPEHIRSEERRVGKECSSRGPQDDAEKTMAKSRSLERLDATSRHADESDAAV